MNFFDQSHQKSQYKEAAGGKDEEQHTVVATDDALSENGSGTEQLAHQAHQGQCPGETKTHEQAVE